ncbi:MULTISPECIES: family 20 glycosylhydrolase [unclassified Carboxylicivirga]|uniref:family 20 glycosylhydrolase n=1 Tax=Carboxylicivirga TaxID=1628153 RepID=UPI003D345AA9
MKKLSMFLMAGLMLLALGCTEKSNTYNLVPYPQELSPQSGAFKLHEDTKVLYAGGENTRFVAQSFADFIAPASGLQLSVEAAPNAKAVIGAILFVEDKAIDGVEGSYKLQVSPRGIVVKANNPVGLFYGFQTLRQLLPAEMESKTQVSDLDFSIPAVSINDAPNFSYRGLHLDVGRHFYPVDFIKKYIDLLALHKMNVFHWHLTEDQGWRLEIKKYPRLAEVAAYRDETLVGHLGVGEHKYDGKRYGGYYTQEQAREIVKYAADRFITVIPEIELPGHAQAALTAYPELGCTGGPYKVAKKWGIFKEVYCAGNEEVFTFLEDVLLEVMDIFPSKYIHIGGDECPKDRWKTCPKCKKRMKVEGCKDAHELQSYFIHRIEKFLNEHDRDIIGWDEILEGGLAPNATVMSWRGIKGGEAAAKQGHNVVMTPNTHFYLDYYQNDPKEDPLAIGGYLPLSKVYSYNPMAGELSEEEAKHIIGVQGNVWTEYMPESSYVEYMTYPRACAIAEVGWLPFEKRDYSAFAKRLQGHFKRLDVMNVNYFDKVLMPAPSVEIVEFIDEGVLELTDNAVAAALYYTTDGTTPTAASSPYQGAIKVSEEGTIKAVAIDARGRSSKVLEVPAKRLSFIEGTASVGASKGVEVKLVKGEFATCKAVDEADGEMLVMKGITVPESAGNVHFGLAFEGVLSIDQDGLYQFILGSDDGSQFLLNGEVVIDNDGYHGMRYKKASLALKKGNYPIKVLYFEGGGGGDLRFALKDDQGTDMNLNSCLSH